MKKCLFLAVLAVAAMASCTKELEQAAPKEYQTLVIRAGFEAEDTRTSLEMNSAQTRADVVWNSGDEIRVLVATGGNSYTYAVFTTTADGVSVGEFSCHSWNPVSNSKYAAVYPADKMKGYSYSTTGGYTFGLVVPPVQTAVKGGVERGLIRSFARVGDSMAPDIKFKHALALLRFRLGGNSANQVKKVKLVANATIAGDCMIHLLDNGEVSYDTDRWYLPLEYGQLNGITLEGNFESGEDYYFAALPCISEGFSLLFFDASDRIIARYSNKALPLRRARITDIGTVTLNGSFGAPDPNVIKYMESNAGSRPVTIAVVAEGFRASEQDKFVSLAKAAVDFVFSTEPFKTYKDYFNVYIMKAVSNESGASITNGNGTITTKKDTYFGARWGASSYGDMESDFDKVWGFVSARCPEIQRGLLTIDEVPVGMIINDNRFGGRCNFTSSGRCVAHAPYTYDGRAISWSFPEIVADNDIDQSGAHYTTEAEYAEVGHYVGDWRNTFLHEFCGHGFGRLADEYWSGTSYSTGTYINGQDWELPVHLNISGTYNNVPWQADLLNNRDALIARDARYSRIGRFQGGGEMILNRWRSEKISCMIDNRQYFSTWQRELIVKRIMSLAGKSFSLSDFFNLDVTLDPVRDSGGAGAPEPDGWKSEACAECGPLAPPEQIDKNAYGIPQPDCRPM